MYILEIVLHTVDQQDHPLLEMTKYVSGLTLTPTHSLILGQPTKRLFRPECNGKWFDRRI